MLCNAQQSKNVLKHALDNQYAILAINADSHAAVYDCLEAALQMDAPVIIESSLWQLKGRSFGAGDPILGMSRYISTLAILANSDRFKDIPVIYHTDHIKGPETMEILEAAIRGISYQYDGSLIVQRASTISLDASEFTEEQNIDHMLNLCQVAKDSEVEVTLEMESAVDNRITSAEEAKQLLGSVEERFPDHIHLWAPGVGTRHGFGHDMDFNPRNIENQRKLTKEITGREIGIALHGSTGMSPQDLSVAAKAGVVKVNWSTESLLIRSEAAREYYSHSEKFDKQYPDWKNTVMDNGINYCISNIYIPKIKERINVLNGAGRASGIQMSPSRRGKGEGN